ncbi:MAG: hypothetical protein ABI595_15300, partial [Actinomycetota bacterium]
ERSGDTHTESTPTTETHSEGTSEEPHSGEGAAPVASAATEHTDARVLGIDLEAPLFVVLAVVISVALAAAVWWRETLAVLVLVLLFALVFAVLDIAEVIHQNDSGRTGVVLVAAVVAVLHLGVAGLAARAVSQTGTTPTARV